MTGVRLPPELEKAVIDWAKRQTTELSKAEAIRRLIERALAGTNIGPAKRSRKKMKKINDHVTATDDAEASADHRKATYADEPEPCEDCDTPQDFWQRSLGVMAGEAIAMRASWSRLYSDWEEFEVTSELVTLARQAADEWSKLAKFLEGRSEIAPKATP
jgi:hypothetical protein